MYVQQTFGLSPENTEYVFSGETGATMKSK